MADNNKGIMLAKSVQKHAGRAKEKILQNLGKVDRTADDIFDDHLNNFNRQQGHANRLQKEFISYIRCIRATQAASKSLMEAISETYEPHWSGYDALQAQTGATESLWQDFAHKLADQVLIPLNTYTGQFPEMKKKIDKRNRKLIDYDGQRHSFQSLQANANKRKDDVKLTKGREQLEEARRTYEILNTELHDELPALYDSRILFLVTNLQTLFATEQVFHSESSKIYAEMEAIVDKLATDSQRGSNTVRRQAGKFLESPAFTASSPTTTTTAPFKQMNNTNSTNNSNYQNQFTTNGTSNANSPSSTSTSCSHQTSRLDSISPTPESTPENLNVTNNAAAAAHPTANSADSTAPSLDNSPLAHDTLSPPAYQNAVELLSTITQHEMATPNNRRSKVGAEARSSAQLDSPNANTTLEAAEKSENAATVSNMHNPVAAEPTSKGGANEVVSSTTDNDVSKSTPTTAHEVEERSSNVKKMAKPAPEQINGNVENVATSHSQDTPTTKATPTDMNNGNAADETNKQTGDDTTSDLPPGVLYRVKATYGYVKEDVDELSFEVGDIIRVIEYDDPEDQFFISNLQEEGWLMGLKEGTTEKGLFPANFTRPI
ncbi:amphiphysin isoform X2 [Eurosta solidaginis]|uniref:amphiphysin isoform X2 n=1 Tax=Eurosta solidaginis TaxID=178769 RepID=UPI0035313D1D